MDFYKESESRIFFILGVGGGGNWSQEDGGHFFLRRWGEGLESQGWAAGGAEAKM